MSSYDIGYNAVWFNNKPVNPRPERIPPTDLPVPIFYKEKDPQEEWLKGYDAALVVVQGYEAGLNGEPEIKKNDGWYYGRCIFLRKKLKPILKAAGKLNLAVFEVSYPEYDDYSGQNFPGSENFRPLSKKELLDSVVCYLAGNRYGKEEDVPTTLEEIKSVFLASCEGEGGYTSLLTREQAKKIQEENEFNRIERIAQKFAAKCGQQMGTMKFLAALDKAVNGVRNDREHWNGGECRMEEWAAHQFAGGGSESYFDDLNYVNGQYDNQMDDLRDVYRYIEQKFPLLFMRYKERKARRRKIHDTSSS